MSDKLRLNRDELSPDEKKVNKLMAGTEKRYNEASKSKKMQFIRSLKNNHSMVLGTISD